MMGLRVLLLVDEWFFRVNMFIVGKSITVTMARIVRPRVHQVLFFCTHILFNYSLLARG